MMIFGVIGQLSSELCTITFIGFLVFLVLLDYTFEHVEEAAKHRGLEHLYENLKKELMSLGLVSFAVFIYELGAKPEPNDQLFLSFEVAHMIFFFMAISFILQALFLVSFSGTIGQQFILSLRTPVKDLIVLYEKARKNAKEWWWFHHGSPLLPTFPPCRASIEFRIIERLFIAQHKLSPEFNFASYVNRLFVLYIAELAHVSPTSWTIVACLVALNYLRIATVDMDKSNGCSSVGSENIHSAGIISTGHRTLGGASTEGENAPVGGGTAGCEVYLLLYTYFCGVLLCLFAAIIYGVTVLYMERIIALSLETDDIKMDANSGMRFVGISFFVVTRFGYHFFLRFYNLLSYPPRTIPAIDNTKPILSQPSIVLSRHSQTNQFLALLHIIHVSPFLTRRSQGSLCGKPQTDVTTRANARR